MILDGYPRTKNQAKYLSEHLDINVVLNLSLREDILIRKLLGRRVCVECKRSYNIENVNEGEYVMPPMMPEKDTKCCVNLVQRDDDKEDIIKRR